MSPAPLRSVRCGLAWALVASATLIVVLFLSVLLRVHQGDPTGPFLVGASASTAPWLIPVATVPGSGFDGQFFLALGLDPFLRSSSMELLDDVRYRARRISWSLAAWSLSLGRTEAVPFALVALNLLAVWCGSVGVSLWARSRGRSPWWGLVYAANLGNVVCIYRMTSDGIVAAMIVWIATFGTKRDERSIVAAAVLLGIAVLQKELALAALPLVLLPALALRHRRPQMVILATLVIVAVWWSYVAAVAPAGPFRAGANLDLPGRGLTIAATASLDSDKSPLHKAKDLLLWGSQVAAIVGALAYAGKARRSPLEDAGLTTSMAIFAILATILSRHVWAEPWSYARVLLPMAALLLMKSLSARPPRSGPGWFGRSIAMSQGLAGIAFALLNLVLMHP